MGSMKKGNLEDGCFWFNIKRAYFGTLSFTRGGRFNEKLTLWELYDEVVREWLFRGVRGTDSRLNFFCLTQAQC